MRKLAKEAGFIFWKKGESCSKGIDWSSDYTKELRRFAELVALEQLVKLTQVDTATLIPGVTRVEIIDDTGRAYVNTKVDSITYSFQDGGQTLKVFC